MKNIVLAALTVLVSVTAIQVQAAPGDAAVAAGKLTSAFSSWGSPSLAGGWKIVEDNGEHYLELGEDFKAKKGPDVKIFLSPTAADQITGDNATNGSVFVELISDFKGSARIAIPSGTDLNAFQSLVFHCEEYSKLWGSSTLR